MTNNSLTDNMRILDEKDSGKIKNNEDSIKYMKTPCNHIFHIKCLTDWM
jgi:hypothetical protein